MAKLVVGEDEIITREAREEANYDGRKNPARKRGCEA